jgi:hypothetical protein
MIITLKNGKVVARPFCAAACLGDEPISKIEMEARDWIMIATLVRLHQPTFAASMVRLYRRMGGDLT